MKGLIMDLSATLTQFFERARKIFHRKTMATRVPEWLWRYTYADYADRVCRLPPLSPSWGRQGRPRGHLRVELPSPHGSLLRRP